MTKHKIPQIYSRTEESVRSLRIFGMTIWEGCVRRCNVRDNDLVAGCVYEPCMACGRLLQLSMEAKLLHIPWMASVLYGSIPLFWFAIHPFADSWRTMRRSPYRILLPIWAVIIFALGWATWPWHSEQIYSSPWMWAPAALLFWFGLRTYAGIRSGFGTHKLSGEAEVRPREHVQELVTTGLHARMRHPIYVAHLANLAGWAIGSGLAVSFALLAVSALTTFPLMIWMEERELEKRFGQSFREYKARVPLVPLPFQRASICI